MPHFSSLAAILRDRVHRTPRRVSFYAPTDLYPCERPEGGFTPLTWSEVGQMTREVALGLTSLGLEYEDRVAILSATRIDWVLADLSVITAGLVTTTIYPNSSDSAYIFILNDSGARVLFAENNERAARVVALRSQCPALKHVVLLEGEWQGADIKTESGDSFVLTWAELRKRGAALDCENPALYNELIDRQTPDRLSTLIYTSGTTGQPKGVELIDDTWLFVGESVAEMRLFDGRDRQLLWLPLSHVFGRMLITLALYNNVATAVDGRIDRIVSNMTSFKPTMMAAVPRIFEKVYNNVVKTVQKGGVLSERVFKTAVHVGREISRAWQEGREPTLVQKMAHAVADKLIFSKVRATFGGQMRYFISGSAPLNQEVAMFFHAAGLNILEGYGLTETGASSCVNRPEDLYFGTVGHPWAGNEVKLADDGEIMLRGRTVMRGYHNLPEATSEVLRDGWFYTGDIGEFDDHNRLRITDRKKDLIKTSGGKYVAPQRLEALLMGTCPYIAQFLVHGEQRNFCTALVTLDEKEVRAWGESQGFELGTLEEMSKDPRVYKLIEDTIQRMNGQLARFETIKKFAILPVVFTEATGELTASLKVRRKVVEQKYKAILDAFYADTLAKVD